MCALERLRTRVLIHHAREVGQPNERVRKGAITQKSALVIAFLVVALGSSGVLGTRAARASDSFSVVDTLGAATTTTRFSVFGSGGHSISGSQFVGPAFTLTQRTVLTEIGGFVNGQLGVPQSAPFAVQIRPSTNGAPDPSTVLATFVLSNDNDPLVTSYESATPNFTLAAGNYFALFAPQNGDSGVLLCCAQDPFSYRAGLTPTGFLLSGTPSASPGEFIAVRILGRLLTAAELLANLEKTVIGVGPGTSLADKVTRAQTDLTNNDLPDTCSTLAAFVNELNAQSGKTIPSEQATALVASAQQIEKTLGC